MVVLSLLPLFQKKSGVSVVSVVSIVPFLPCHELDVHSVCVMGIHVAVVFGGDGNTVNQTLSLGDKFAPFSFLSELFFFFSFMNTLIRNETKETKNCHVLQLFFF